MKRALFGLIVIGIIVLGEAITLAMRTSAPETRMDNKR